MAEKNERPIVVAENRKARFNYAIEDTLEAGIALTGTEVKSIRSVRPTAESYAAQDGEIWLINANIRNICRPTASTTSRSGCASRCTASRQQADGRGRPRRHDADPLKLYFNERGRAKLLLAVAKRKKLHDKRESEERDWGREKGRLLRARG